MRQRPTVPSLVLAALGGLVACRLTTEQPVDARADTPVETVDSGLDASDDTARTDTGDSATGDAVEGDSAADSTLDSAASDVEPSPGDRVVASADARFVAHAEYSYPEPAVSDVDGDGDDDLLVGDGEFVYFFADAPNGDFGPADAVGEIQDSGSSTSLWLAAILPTSTSSAGAAVLTMDRYATETLSWLPGPLFGTLDVADASTSLTAAVLAASSGDLDDDGVPDLAVGTPDGVEVLTPATWESMAEVTCSDAEVRSFGSRLLARDIDGDGVDDLFTSALDAGDSAGAVFVFAGPLTGATTSADASAQLTGDTPGLGAGLSLAVGDLNGDGYVDLAGGAWDPSFEHGGAVWVAPGPVAGSTPLSMAVATTFTAVGGDEWVGEDLAVGDIDANGRDDLLITAAGHAEFDGAVYVWTELPTGSVDAEDAPARIIGDAPNDSIGLGLAIGDLDGDGLPDVAVAGADRSTWIGFTVVFQGGWI